MVNTKVLLIFDCPRCSYHVDAATAVDGDARPQPGDISLCLRCGAPLEFSAGEPPRWLTYEEVIRLPKEALQDVAQAVLIILTLRPSRVRSMKEGKA